jgi:hypothetical protein
MTPNVLRLLSASLVLAPWSTGLAQTGRESGGITLTSRVECGFLAHHAGAGAAEQNSLVALVLWRGQEGWRDRATASDIHRAYRAAMRAAEDADRRFMGGQEGGIVFAAAFDEDSLYVLDHSYALPRGDSALVVMVDRIDSIGGIPAVIATAAIHARLGAEFWTKQWSSGDTLVVIHSRQRGRILLEALQASSALRQFVD